MPSKFERTTMHLAEKFNTQIEDAAAMSSLVDSLTEQCFNEEQFMNTNSHYDPSEVLSDAIATVSFSRFCRVSGKSIVSIVGKVAIVE